MLKTLDIIIGATTVLLIFSMAVTVITQAVANMFQRRGKHLMSGLADLIQQLGIPERAVSETIAKAVLTHPLVADGKGKMGAVIHREEFTKLVMDLAGGGGAVKLDETTKQKLTEMLKKSGIENPDETLKKVRAVAMQLEASNPELANDVRQAKALIQEAASDYVARVNSWFDQTIDRVSQRFSQYTHLVTIGAALVVVLVVQLDIIAVVDRLSIDDQFRNSVVTAATASFSKADANATAAALKTGEKTGTDAKPADKPAVKTDSTSTAASGQTPANPGTSSTAGAGETTTKPDANSTGAADKPADKPADGTKVADKDVAKAGADAGAAKDKDKNKKEEAVDAGVPKVDPKPYYDLLSKAGLITLPTNGDYWKQLGEPRKYPGMLLAVLLISLGAPFWYNILKDLLGLRSQIAKKDDDQRVVRQTTQTASDTSPAKPGGAPAVKVGP
jgi:hypothetical protein